MLVTRTLLISDHSPTVTNYQLPVLVRSTSGF